MMKAVIVACVAFAAVTPALAQMGTKFSSAGEWTVYRDMDPMSGTPTCSAAYKDDTSVQLNKDSIDFVLKRKGGVSGYHLRWDDDPMGALMRPGSNDAFFLTSADFAKLLKAKRLRVQVTTAANAVINYDLNLASVPQAVAIMSAQNCNH